MYDTAVYSQGLTLRRRPSNFQMVRSRFCSFASCWTPPICLPSLFHGHGIQAVSYYPSGRQLAESKYLDIANYNSPLDYIPFSFFFRAHTPSRRPPTEFIPPVQEPYQYIIFRASEVKDLAVDEPAPRRSVHDDPAVLGVRVSSVSIVPPNFRKKSPMISHAGIRTVRPWSAVRPVWRTCTALRAQRPTTSTTAATDAPRSASPTAPAAPGRVAGSTAAAAATTTTNPTRCTTTGSHRSCCVESLIRRSPE